MVFLPEEFNLKCSVQVKSSVPWRWSVKKVFIVFKLELVFSSGFFIQSLLVFIQFSQNVLSIVSFR